MLRRKGLLFLSIALFGLALLISNCGGNGGGGGPTGSQPLCGNGVVEAGEFCDGGGINTASCDVDCTAPSCVDGICNAAAGETVANCADCTCPTGTTNCGGTCVRLQTNVNNCGACGNSCTGQNLCLNGACACRPGLSLVGSNCVDPMSDPSNCGAPPVVCGGATPVCQQGVCVPSCAGGFSQCGNACVNLDRDELNCGSCNAACSNTEVCPQGNCQEFFFATSCTACPCTECVAPAGTCAAYPGAPTSIICVEGGIAP